MIELIAVALSLACVVLAARRDVGTWPVGMVAVVAYFVVFVRAKLYADAALQLIFLGQGAYGWTQWNRYNGESDAHGGVHTLELRSRVLVAVGVTCASLFIGTALARYTDASRPFLDATVSVLSLTANWLLARRILETWAIWCTADVLYIGLFISNDLLASAALYTLFLGLAIAGWQSWLRTTPATERTRAGWAL